MNKKPVIIYFVLFAIAVVLCLIFIKAEAEAPEMTYEQKIESYVHQLATCESGNDPSEVNEKDGGSPSYGYLMYKLGTFWNYNKKFNVFPELTIDNLHAYVMDKDKSVTMTKAIIMGEEKGYLNWTNCTVGNSPNKIGKPPLPVLE